IQRLKPDVVVTIDAPGFNFRVAKALQGSGITLIHYVAPTVWAYKPQRAEKVAALFDQLIVLLPFEPPYFEKVGIPCTYVGHPVVEETVTGGDPLRFRKTHNIPKEAPLLCLLPGSRKGEIHRHLPVYSKTMSILKKQFPDLHCLVVTPPDIADYILDETKMWPVPLVVSSRLEDKAAAYAASNIALVKSGTAALELSLAEVPMIVTYRVNPISAWMLRRMLKVKCVNIVNLISGKQIIPELLQEECRPPKLAEAVSGLLRYEDMCEKQVAESREALTQLGLGTPPTPSERAAEVVLNAVK
ncbi:MAG: lipid-A-disaccharide synthase, partial [Rickettsiales bacterium]|nr:lipid-A-disaccharide synthase [Rickettsiales bacterium]